MTRQAKDRPLALRFLYVVGAFVAGGVGAFLVLADALGRNQVGSDELGPVFWFGLALLACAWTVLVGLWRSVGPRSWLHGTAVVLFLLVFGRFFVATPPAKQWIGPVAAALGTIVAVRTARPPA